MPTLDFKGKPLVYAYHLTVPSRTLDVCTQKSTENEKTAAKISKAPSLDDNLIIHGDNLHALKALMPRYAGRVNCIYIDPPYNTGNEQWIYNDNVNSPMMREWLKSKSPVDGEDLQRHDKWLCMMWPRLHLLRELLSDDGVIFVSIDDNEQHHLRMMMDEIFGAENFVSVLPRLTKKAGKTSSVISKNNDYLVIYKNLENIDFNGIKVEDEEYKHSDEHVKKRGLYKLSQALDYSSIQYSKSLDYEINLDGQIFRPGGVSKKEMLKRQNKNPKSDYCWRWSKKLFDFGLENGFIVIKSSKDEKRIYTKTYLNAKIKSQSGRYIIDYGQREKSATTLEFIDNKYSNDNSKKELERIFENKVFEYSKPPFLIKKIIQLSTDKNAIILDSFAGSGTTAQAVLELNKQDGGNRKFILVECEDYANRITAERVRRVIKGVPKAKDDSLKKGLGGSFTYCTLGDEINPENMLKGENLPLYETLARHLFWTATGQSPDKINPKTKRGKDGFFCETENRRFYLIYEPKLEFLRDAASALNSERAKRIAKETKKKQQTAIVFATHKFMGQKELTEMGIVFCGLPYGIK